MNNDISILELLEERKKFPIGSRYSENDYIESKINSNQDRIFLVIPHISIAIRDRILREKILNNWYVYGLFELSAIWKPYSSIHFDLLVLQKNKPTKISFSRYLGDKTFTSRFHFRNASIIGEQIIDQDFKDYLYPIDSFIQSGIAPLSASLLKFWQIDYKPLTLEQLTTSYNEPDLIENERKLREEKTIELGEIAQILKPRPTKDIKGKVIKTRDFIYPLKIEKLSNDNASTIKLQKGDILLSDSFSGQKKFYIITDQLNTDLYASSFLTIIRLSSTKVTPEYLFLYLQSEVVQKYFSRYARGLFQRIYSSDLKKLPVVIPDLVTQNKSKAIFETRYLHEGDNIIEQINKELYDANTPTKPIQKEFILEELGQLNMKKREVVEKVIKGDLKELNTCIEKKLYKSFLIISGSVLEAFLLDWLCEIEKKDYFSPKVDEIKLHKIIELLGSTKKQLLNQDLTNKADNIRKKRNLVHPKRYFNSNEEINDDICYMVLNDLKEIIFSRTN